MRLFRIHVGALMVAKKEAVLWERCLHDTGGQWGYVVWRL
jgi:hypothetical protein